MSSFGFLAVPCVPAVPRAWACINASWVWHSIFDNWFHWLVLANWWIHFVTVFLVVKFLMNLTKNNFECFQWSTCSADYFGIFSPLCGCFGRKGGNTPFPRRMVYLSSINYHTRCQTELGVARSQQINVWERVILVDVIRYQRINRSKRIRHMRPWTYSEKARHGEARQ